MKDENEPLNVYVDEDTAVHVHVQKGGKLKRSPLKPPVQSKQIADRLRQTRRSLSPSRRKPILESPWIPPPARSSKGRLMWLDEYERTRQQLNRKKEESIISRRALEEQEAELNHFRDELKYRGSLNDSLRKSLDVVKKEANKKDVEKDMIGAERDAIMKRLVEAEFETEEASNYLSSLKGKLRRKEEDSRIDKKMLINQRDMLLEKLSDFEDTNKTLRKLLREQHRKMADRDANDTEDLKNANEQIDRLRAKLNRVIKGRGSVDVEYSKLQSRMADRDMELDTVRIQLASLKQDNSALRVENEQLRDNFEDVKRGSTQAFRESDRLRGTVSEYEALLSDIKNENDRAKDENDRLATKLNIQEKELQRSHHDNVHEQERAEQANTELERTRLRAGHNLDEAKMLGRQITVMEGRILESETKNRDLAEKLNKKDNMIRSLQAQQEDKVIETNNLSHRLEQSMAENRQQTDILREKSSAREKHIQQQLLELDNELTSAKTELLQIRRSKDESERKFNARLQDMKDRLEQSHSTNRSMQNYVQFLKSSYANVFTDSPAGIDAF